MFDSVLQFVLGVIGSVGLSQTPIASAESLEEQLWLQKTPEQTVELTVLEKNRLLELSDQTLYWVVAVLDGDTLLVSGPDRGTFQVRLLAVDTNEINGPDSSAECYGAEASLFTLNFLKNRAIYLTADPANQDLDPYGRQLRYVDVLQEDGGTLRLNDALLREGMASYPAVYPTSTPEYFQSLEKSAQESGKGLWTACS